MDRRDPAGPPELRCLVCQHECPLGDADAERHTEDTGHQSFAEIPTPCRRGFPLTQPPNPDREPYTPSMGGAGGSITNTQERPLLYTPVAEQIRSLREDSVLEKGWKQVAKIYSAQKATLRVVEEYDQTTSNYGPGTYDRDKYDMVAVCGGIVKDLVDDVIEKLYFPPALEAIERAQRLNKRDKSDLLKSADKAVYEFAAMGVSESLME